MGVEWTSESFLMPIQQQLKLSGNRHRHQNPQPNALNNKETILLNLINPHLNPKP